jgi:hypothetical protein
MRVCVYAALEGHIQRMEGCSASALRQLMLAGFARVMPQVVYMQQHQQICLDTQAAYCIHT